MVRVHRRRMTVFAGIVKGSGDGIEFVIWGGNMPLMILFSATVS